MNNPDDQSRFHLYANNDDDVSEFQKKESKHQKGTTVIVVLAVALVVLLFISIILVVPYSQFSFTPAYIFEHIKFSLKELYRMVTGTYTTYTISLIRYVAVIFTGAALAACGVVYKGSFRNSLAGPSTMGVTSGASLGALVYLLLFTESASAIELGTEAVQADLSYLESMTFWETYQQQICILIGSFAAVGVTLGVSSIAGRGKLSPTAMILSGTVLSSLTSNVMMIVQYYIVLNDPEDTRIEALQDLMMGSFDNITTLRTLLLYCIPLIICFVVVIIVSGKLNMLAIDEDEAQTMGINVRFYRYLMIIIGTILTAMSVAFCGRIGFLGFMVPMVANRLVGADMKKQVPASMLIGAILLLLVYDVARFANMTSYINMFTSPIGAIVMFVSLMHRRKDGEGNANLPARGQMRMGMR